MNPLDEAINSTLQAEAIMRGLVRELNSGKYKGLEFLTKLGEFKEARKIWIGRVKSAENPLPGSPELNN